mmetsp:Transcript_95967/g.271491  ORF Transcript_95967/g.271491 Transcript_95967/m.271491 type:complete len:392 (+) Transcript_95967:765-1940(+)
MRQLRLSLRPVAMVPVAQEPPLAAATRGGLAAPRRLLHLDPLRPPQGCLTMVTPAPPARPIGGIERRKSKAEATKVDGTAAVERTPCGWDMPASAFPRRRGCRSRSAAAPVLGVLAVWWQVATRPSSGRQGSCMLATCGRIAIVVWNGMAGKLCRRHGQHTPAEGFGQGGQGKTTWAHWAQLGGRRRHRAGRRRIMERRRRDRRRFLGAAMPPATARAYDTKGAGTTATGAVGTKAKEGKEGRRTSPRTYMTASGSTGTRRRARPLRRRPTWGRLPRQLRWQLRRRLRRRGDKRQAQRKLPSQRGWRKGGKEPRVLLTAPRKPRRNRSAPSAWATTASTRPYAGRSVPRRPRSDRRPGRRARISPLGRPRLRNRRGRWASPKWTPNARLRH